jgi:predicted phage baseplate assembly protein
MDVDAARITFGNGVNGRVPPSGAQVSVTYAVSDGAQGGVARNRRWEVAGFGGTFGVNPDAVTGGADRADSRADRREARRVAREERPLVSSADIEAAARTLPLLEVARAWVVTPGPGVPRTGAIRLIAMRHRTGTVEPELAPEGSRWLDAIRRRLAPRMPLGTRLVVTAPRYVEFTIQARIECAPGREPSAVQAEVMKMLGRRLALVPAADAKVPRSPGVPVTQRDVAAWLRTLDGVARVTELRLLDAESRPVPKIAVPPSGLPRWIATRSPITVARRAPGGAR